MGGRVPFCHRPESARIFLTQENGVWYKAFIMAIRKDLELTSKEAAQLVSISEAQLQFYAGQRLLPCIQDPHVGRGRSRTYGRADVLALAVLRELNKLSIGTSMMAAIMNTWRSEYRDWWEAQRKGEPAKGILVIYRLRKTGHPRERFTTEEGLAVEFFPDGNIGPGAWGDVKTAIVVNIGALAEEIGG